jgi:hypothetical protein
LAVDTVEQHILFRTVRPGDVDRCGSGLPLIDLVDDEMPFIRVAAVTGQAAFHDGDLVRTRGCCRGRTRAADRAVREQQTEADDA